MARATSSPSTPTLSCLARLAVAPTCRRFWTAPASQAGSGDNLSLLLAGLKSARAELSKVLDSGSRGSGANVGTLLEELLKGRATVEVKTGK